MTNYQTRERALELARSVARDCTTAEIVDTAKAFEEYLVGDGVDSATWRMQNPPTTEPATPAASAFTEALTPGISTHPLRRVIGQRNAIERLNEDSLTILRRALTEALQLGQNKIAPEHLLLAIIRDGGTSAAAALIDMAGTGQNARKAVIKRMTQ